MARESSLVARGPGQRSAWVMDGGAASEAPVWKGVAWEAFG